MLADDKKGEPACCCQCLALLASKVQTGEVGPATSSAAVRETAADAAQSRRQAGVAVAHATASSCPPPEGRRRGLRPAGGVFSGKYPEAARQQALDALVVIGDTACLDTVKATARRSALAGSVAFRGQVLAALGKLDEPKVADLVLEHYSKMEPELQPRAIELLTQRAVWGQQLIQKVGEEGNPADGPERQPGQEAARLQGRRTVASR